MSSDVILIWLTFHPIVQQQKNSSSDDPVMVRCSAYAMPTGIAETTNVIILETSFYRGELCILGAKQLAWNCRFQHDRSN